MISTFNCVNKLIAEKTAMRTVTGLVHELVAPVERNTVVATASLHHVARRRINSPLT